MIDQETMDLLSVPERVAAVDPGFHPVLSFPDGNVYLNLFSNSFLFLDSKYLKKIL